MTKNILKESQTRKNKKEKLTSSNSWMKLCPTKKNAMSINLLEWTFIQEQQRQVTTGQSSTLTDSTLTRIQRNGLSLKIRNGWSSMMEMWPLTTLMSWKTSALGEQKRERLTCGLDSLSHQDMVRVRMFWYMRSEWRSRLNYWWTLKNLQSALILHHLEYLQSLISRTMEGRSERYSRTHSKKRALSRFQWMKSKSMFLIHSTETFGTTTSIFSLKDWFTQKSSMTSSSN